jgi:hypothetical protein
VTNSGNNSLLAIDISSGKVRTLFRSSFFSDIASIRVDESETCLFFSLKSKPSIWLLAWPDQQPVNIHNSISCPSQPEPTQNKFAPLAYINTQANIASWALYGTKVYICQKLPVLRDNSPIVWCDLNNPSFTPEINLHDWLPISDGKVWRLQIDTNSEKPVQKHRLFNEIGAMTFDLKRGVIYVSDSVNNRILGLRILANLLPEKQPPFFDPHVEKIFLFGNSLSFRIADTFDAELDNVPQQHSFFAYYRRLEFWLNLISFMKGSNRQFEVVFGGTHGGFDRGSISNALIHLESQINLHRPKMIIMVSSMFDVFYDAFEYIHKPYLNGSLSNVQDPEFNLQDVRKRILHPNGIKLEDVKFLVEII